MEMENQMDGYPRVIDAPVAWGEMDAFQHVSNIVHLRYFKNAKLRIMLAIDLSQGH